MATTITEEQVKQSEELLYGAIRQGDVTMLERLLHDRLLFMKPDGEVLTKEQDLETYRSGLLQVDRLDPVPENIRIIGDTAVVTVLLSLGGRFSGEPFNVQYRYIRFWKKEADGLRVIGGSAAAR